MKFFMLFLLCFILALQESQAQINRRNNEENILERYARWFFVYHKNKVHRNKNAACILKNVFHEHGLTDDDGYLDKEKILSKLPYFSQDHIDQYAKTCSRSKSNTEKSHCDYTECILENLFDEELAHEYILTRTIDDESDQGSSPTREDFWRCMDQKKELPQKEMEYYNPLVDRGATYSCIVDVLGLVDKEGVLDKGKALKFAKNDYFKLNKSSNFNEIYDVIMDEALQRDFDNSGRIDSEQNLDYFMMRLDQRGVFWRLFLTQYEMENFVAPENRPFSKTTMI